MCNKVLLFTVLDIVKRIQYTDIVVLPIFYCTPFVSIIYKTRHDEHLSKSPQNYFGVNNPFRYIT